MGILDGFIQGAAEQSTNLLNNQIRDDAALSKQQALSQFNAELADKKERALMALRENMANKQRTDQMGRIDQAAGGMVQPAIDQKRGQVQAGIEDQANWTPEQQAAVDQSLAMDKSRAMADPRVRTQAAIATGDIDPKSAATLTNQGDIAQMRAEAAAKEAENKNQRAADKNDLQREMMELRIEAARSGGGKAPSGYRFNPDGTLSSIPGGPADKNATDKALPASVLKQLQEVRDNATTITTLDKTFKDEFAGKGMFGIGADAQLGASANIGADKDAVAWWKNYKKQAELVERHAMFGASLTPGEQASWRSADVAPGMDPDVVKENLRTRAELAQKVLENTRQDFIDAGHSETRVNSIAGRRAADRGGKESATKTPDASSLEAEMRRRGLLK